MTVILGIDPGSRVTGYGLIRMSNHKMIYIDSGCIRTAEGAFSSRLLTIFKGIGELMQSYTPQEVAIEQIFMHTNASAALKLGHARGVAMVACAARGLPLFEYTPRAVKQSIVGYGAAEKDQVKKMVMQFLSLTRPPQTDASDALAIAICHIHTRGIKQ